MRLAKRRLEERLVSTALAVECEVNGRGVVLGVHFERSSSSSDFEESCAVCAELVSFFDDGCLNMRLGEVAGVQG